MIVIEITLMSFRFNCLPAVQQDFEHQETSATLFIYLLNINLISVSPFYKRFL